jgi:hypothetical protein
MGFRNPITSISADQIGPGTLPAGVVGTELATGPAGTARVRIYQDASLPSGVVELDPGVFGRDPSRLTLGTPSSQADGSSSGSFLSLKGAGVGFGNVNPPLLQLNTTRTGPGTYKTVAQLTADAIALDGDISSNFKMATPVVVTDASGQGRYTFPTAFPVGCFGAVVGSAGTFGGGYIVSYISADAAGVNVKLQAPNGAAIASTSALISVFAVGR